MNRQALKKLLFVLLLSQFATPTNAASINVENHSFELPPVTRIPGFLNSTAGPFCLASACPSVPGWDFAVIGGLFRPNGSVFPANAFDGQQVFYSDIRNGGGATAVQYMPNVLYQPSLDYALTVSVGNRAEASIPFANGSVILFSGTDPNNVVGELDLATITAPSRGQFIDVTLFLSAADINAAGVLGDSIGISLGDALIPGNAGQTIFDNVRLTAVPVPAAFWLLLSGLGLLGCLRRP